MSATTVRTLSTALRGVAAPAAPVPNDDVIAAVQRQPVTGDVLLNDAGTGLFVSGVRFDMGGADVPVALGGPTIIDGIYGRLTIQSDGTYSYISTVEGLGVGQTVEDVFSYTVTNDEGVATTAMLSLSVAGSPLGDDLNNILIGSDAADLLDGGAGDDIMVGGMGDDVYVVGQHGDIVAELGGEGVDTALSSLDYYFLTANVENLSLADGAIAAVGNTDGNGLFGNAENNVLIGKEGNDLMVGGAGDDVYEVTDAGDYCVEEAGGGANDIVASYLDQYALSANVENMVLIGSATTGIGNDLSNGLFGNAENNVLIGGGGADAMRGEAGDDTYEIDSLGDWALENAGEGYDTVFSLIDGYTLQANLEKLVLAGSAVDGTGNDGANDLIGNAADNRLDGGAGDDALFGGLGADTFVWAGAGAGKDSILDFNAAQGDHIDLAKAGFTDFADLLTHASESSGDTVIALGGGDTLTLKGVALAELSADVFGMTALSAPVAPGDSGIHLGWDPALPASQQQIAPWAMGLDALFVNDWII